MKKLTTILLVAMFIFALSLTTVAKMHGKSHHKGECSEKKQHMKCDCLEKLNLTDEQKAELEKLHKSHYEAMKSYKTEMTQYHEKFRSLLKADKPDMDAIDKLIKERAEKTVKKQKAMVDHMIKVRSILTDEQKKVWDEHKHMMMGKGHMCGMHKSTEGCESSGCSHKKKMKHKSHKKSECPVEKEKEKGDK